MEGHARTNPLRRLTRGIVDRFGMGRLLQLRLLLGLLVVASVVYVVVTVGDLAADYRETGSLQALWEREWRSGASLNEIVQDRLFQLFVLILAWSLFLRVRFNKLGHLRLRRSEQKYRSIINHAGEAIFLLDDKGRVLEWNKKAEKLFGVYRRHALGENICKLDMGLDLPVLRIFADVKRVQRSLTYEATVEKRGVAPMQVSLTFSCIHGGSGPMAEKSDSFAVIARDITSEKQFETRMSETEKLAGIGQLAAGIAHQLNTPLGSILLSAQMLEETVENEDDSEDINRIIRQTEQCRGIIKGLLNFARPTGSERGRVDLAGIIDDTVFLMEKQLKVAGVEVSVSVTAATVVYGNRNELEQVFFNLLANALDAMSDGGHVKIEIGEGGPGELKLVFADTGEGIPAEAQDRVFLPFFTTKDYGKGTGLGLSIVARIMHEHGGRIELDSTPGRGTTFTLWFPLAREGQGAGSSQLALIDDEPDQAPDTDHGPVTRGQSPDA